MTITAIAGASAVLVRVPHEFVAFYPDHATVDCACEESLGISVARAPRGESITVCPVCDRGYIYDGKELFSWRKAGGPIVD
jgi:hypothetical protein